MKRQLLPPNEIRSVAESKQNGNETENGSEIGEVKREVGPFHYQASRSSTSELPYSTRHDSRYSPYRSTPVRNNKRGRDSMSTSVASASTATTTPDAPRYKRRDVDQASPIVVTTALKQRSHLDLNSEHWSSSPLEQQPPPPLALATSEDDFFDHMAAQTSDSVVFDMVSSSPPIHYESSPEHSMSYHDSACFVDDTVKIESARKATREISAGERLANNAINEAIMEGKSTVDLSQHELTTVPEQLADFGHVIPSTNTNSKQQQGTRLFLDRNFLQTLSPALFSIEHLTVLVLRNNNLIRIPPAIGRLTNLVELSIAQNKLQHLPSEILDLPKLAIFSCHPNQFMDRPGGAGKQRVPISPATGQTNSRILTSSQLHLEPHSKRKQATLSLQEKCLIEIGQIANGVDLRWSLVDHTASLVEEATEAAREQIQCGVCHQRMIHGVGHCYEWRDAVLGQCDVVFKRYFCTFNCVEKWKLA